MRGDPIFFADANELGRWFAQNGATCPEVVVGFIKTHTGRAELTWPQAVDEALCVGWIDGVRQRIDDERYKIRFTPRKADSRWSAVNIDRVSALRAEGRMTQTGLDAFAKRTEAKSRTASYEQEKFPELSDTEIKEFKKNKAGWAFYQKLAPSYRRKVNWIVISAKQPATRERRFKALVAACAEGRRP
jgi:uncharacterized protein YdeI (YjbR/CyaY-like superfamily)